MAERAVPATEVRLLVVCLGNICRSPMAEGLLRERIATSPLAGRVAIDSAGTGDWHIGHPPDRRAIAQARGAGVDIGHLRGRQVTPGDFHRFDWLLCADRENLRDLRAMAPPGRGDRAQLLLEWAGVPGDGEIPDPYTGGERHFRDVWSLLEQAADGAVARLLREVA